MILSNRQSVEEVATKMKNASDAIESSVQKPITKANQTTLTVSHKSQEAHEEMKQLVLMFHSSFEETIKQIQSVAIEFERTDQQLHDSYNNCP